MMAKIDTKLATHDISLNLGGKIRIASLRSMKESPVVKSLRIQYFDANFIHPICLFKSRRSYDKYSFSHSPWQVSCLNHKEDINHKMGYFTRENTSTRYVTPPQQRKTHNGMINR